MGILKRVKHWAETKAASAKTPDYRALVLAVVLLSFLLMATLAASLLCLQYPSWETLP
jgi:hypothetical protein